MSKEEPKPEFSKIRSFLWPVHSFELKKLIPMLLMAFFIGFAYNILRNMKDALVVTAAASGAEAIPFIKVWAMLPMAVLLTSIFVKLSHRYTTEQVFYIMTCIFLVFFFCFTFLLYPAQDYLHPHNVADYLQTTLPTGCMGLVAMFRYWTFTLFYAMSELWGTIMLSVLFWGFANEVTRVAEATRFYGLFGLGANFASIASGKVSCFLSDRSYDNTLPGIDVWHQSLILLTICVLSSGILLMGVFRWLNVTIISKDKEHSHVHISPEKPKGSIRENFAYLTKSKYLISIAVIVFAYNVFINLVEVIWKDQVKQLHPNPNEYNSYMGYITMITGIIATVMGLFLSGNLIRKFGWAKAAMFTPVVLLITSIGFFGFLLAPEDRMAAITTFLGISPLAMVVFFGSAQNCLSRASKYTVFDATKELSFIPLSRESRVKGKAAIDGVGSRLGKSGGSVIHQGLLMVFSTLIASAPYVASIILVVLLGWFTAIRSLGKQFTNLTASQAKDAAAANQAAAPTLAPEQERAPQTVT